LPAVIALVLSVTNLHYSVTRTPVALAQNPTLQGAADSRTLAQLTPKQKQEIIEKNARIRKLQEGIIDHKIKILGSKKQERTLLGELEEVNRKNCLQNSRPNQTNRSSS
jgi:hypothetical protein